MKKLNSTVARILAEEAKDRIKIIKQSELKKRVKEAEGSPEFLELKRLNQERNKLTTRYEDLKGKLFSKYPKVVVNGGWQGQPLGLSVKSSDTHVDVTELKNKILLANHIQNIDPTKVVGFVVKQFDLHS